jgi:hypothetical protein
MNYFLMPLFFLASLILPIYSYGSTNQISGDYYTTDGFPCYRKPVIQVKVNFDSKTFKNSYIDDVYRELDLVPPADQAFGEKESCFHPKNWDRAYCVVATFHEKTVSVSQYYKDYNVPRDLFSEDYIFSNNLQSFKRKKSNAVCDYKMMTPRNASKNDLLLKNGALFKSSKKDSNAYSDPTGLVWSDTLRKGDKIVEMNYKEAKSYCESKGMRLPSEGELEVLLYYMKKSTPIKVVGTNYLLEEMFPEFSKYEYWGEGMIYSSNRGPAWIDENSRNDIDGTSIGVKCVWREN